MKVKNLFIIGLGLALVGLALPATAQNFTSRSFLNARSVMLTNVIGITNLTSSVSRGTNIASTIYTNEIGTRVVSTNGAGDKVNLLKWIPLVVDRNAMFVSTAGVTNANIFIRLGSAGAAGTNSSTFVFAAIPSDSEKEATAAADLWSFSTTANTAYPQSFTVKVPYDKFIGCKGLMLQSASTTATVANSEVWLLECSLNAYAP